MKTPIKNDLNCIIRDQYKDSFGGNDKISILNTIFYIQKRWKVIIFTGFIGLVTSILYLINTSSTYEAKTLIQVARVRTPQNTLGVNAEEPAALIARMSSPTSFESATISACGLEQTADGGGALIKAVKLVIPKGLASAVELKVRLTSRELATACAKSVFEQIAQSQTLLSESLRRPQKIRLAIVKERLEQDQSLLVKVDQTKGANAATYFALLSQKRVLEDERDALELILSDESSIKTQMQFPIEVTSKPIYPKRELSLLVGIFGGLLLGLVIILVDKKARHLKLELSRFRGSCE